MARSWMRLGLAAVAVMAMAPAARAYDSGKAGQDAEKAGAEVKGEGAEVRASAETQTKTNDARTTAPDSATTGNTDRMGSSSGATAATTTDSKSERSDKKASTHDNTDIIKKLHAANVMEVEAAKVAKDNAEREDVKQFAELMEKDHGDMKDALEKLAENRNLKLDDGAQMKQHEAHVGQMKDMKGAKFDRHYTSMMVMHHEKDLKEVKAALQRAQKSGDNELVQVLQNAQTTMKGHHRMAKDLDKNKGQRMGRRGADHDATKPSSESSQGAAGAHGGAADPGPQPQTR